MTIPLQAFDWLVIYDIADPKRLHRVADALEDFGCRWQESVFVCSLDEALLDKLQQRLDGLIDAGEDTIRYFPLCRHDTRHRRTDGRDPPADLPGTWIL